MVTLNPDHEVQDPATRKLPPTLLLGVDDSKAVMREEIFGPLLPIETHQKFRRGHRANQCAGGVTVNDTLWHFAHHGLPFGGIGGSGLGAYHGEASFRTFTHEKPVFLQPRLAAAKLLYPPYGATFEKLLALLKRLTT